MMMSSFPQGRRKDEDDELSELQLRLLALQSASKKWQQKEQQVMKESKEKITKAKPVSEKGGAAARPASDKGALGAKPMPDKAGFGAKSVFEKGGVGAKATLEKARLGLMSPQEWGKSVGKTHPGKKYISPGENCFVPPCVGVWFLWKLGNVV